MQHEYHADAKNRIGQIKSRVIFPIWHRKQKKQIIHYHIFPEECQIFDIFTSI